VRVNQQRVDYPVFRRLDDNAVVKPAYSTVTGPVAAERSKNHRYPRLLITLRVSLVAALVLLLAGKTRSGRGGALWGRGMEGVGSQR
jgi:hypothetical protein